MDQMTEAELIELCEGTWEDPFAKCPHLERLLGEYDRYFRVLEALSGKDWSE
jgi:hypothetical protein